MAYRITEEAASDIVEIYVYGAQTFGTVQAERYHAGLEIAFERIAAQPLLMRERTEIQPPVRVYPKDAHIIVYLIEESGGVLIIRVLHHRQDWEHHLSA